MNVFCAIITIITTIILRPEIRLPVSFATAQQLASQYSNMINVIVIFACEYSNNNLPLEFKEPPSNIFGLIFHLLTQLYKPHVSCNAELYV